MDAHETFLIFQFQMPLEEVERRTLWVTVWHSDMFGRNDFLGEVMLPINTIPLDDPQPRWYSLQDRVSLPYLPQFVFLKINFVASILN